MAYRVSKSIAVSVASLALVAGVAEAGPKKRAPITYADGVSRTDSQPVTQSSGFSQTVSPQVTQSGDPRTDRLEFRYPDQPNTYYGANGARPADEETSPMVFSSPKSAISAEDAVQYAATSPTVSSAADTQRDPAITPGGFDARAAAAKAAAKTDANEVRVTASGSRTGVPVGRPLTLSKVKTNPDATLTEERGRAGVYADGFDGQPTANGEIYDETAMMAAHPNLPLPSLVQVINRSNKREIVVRVNDRGPFSGNRAMDLSPRAAQMLGFGKGETADVTIRYLGPAPVLRAKAEYASAEVTEQSMPPLAQPTYQAPEPAPVIAQRATYSPPAAQPSVAMAGYYIQAGSFSDIGNAQRLTSALGRKLPVEIMEARVRNADYFRVMIGPFTSRTQAETYRIHLLENGIADGFIVEK
ncbi:MAG: septal ring lytic transglycosylase RlpA family protein [Henriciella sp.]|nr:septal ring lytic transglycosylase RlpA family protein [Henriciella sp.]